MKSNKKYQKIMKNVKKCLICVDKSSIIIINFQKIGKNEIKTPLVKGKRIRCYTKVANKNIGANKNVFSSREIKGVEKDVKMNTINILDAANFLIRLYYHTAKKYTCTRTKIEKLLSIANIVAFSYGHKLFGHNIVVNRCGVGVPILGGFLFSNIIDGKDTNRIIAKNEILDICEIPPAYSVELEDEQHIKLLTDVFLNFGAYDAWEIGKMFDEFKNDISIENSMDAEHPIVDQRKTCTYFNSVRGASEKINNEIVKFIANYEI